jgi:hypothetical protein
VKHTITVIDGMLTVEGGVTIGGVTIDMVTSIRDVLISMSDLCKALDGHAALEDLAIQAEYKKAVALLKYLRDSKQFSKGEDK